MVFGATKAAIRQSPNFDYNNGTEEFARARPRRSPSVGAGCAASWTTRLSYRRWVTKTMVGNSSQTGGLTVRRWSTRGARCSRVDDSCAPRARQRPRPRIRASFANGPRPRGTIEGIGKVDSGPLRERVVAARFGVTERVFMISPAR